LVKKKHFIYLFKLQDPNREELIANEDVDHEFTSI